jgi:hypothetical protein
MLPSDERFGLLTEEVSEKKYVVYTVYNHFFLRQQVAALAAMIKVSLVASLEKLLSISMHIQRCLSALSLQLFSLFLMLPEFRIQDKREPMFHPQQHLSA